MSSDVTVNWFGPEIEAKIRHGAVVGITEAIGIVEDRAVALIMNGPKSGRIYVRRGVSHQASAPGEPPASDTGALVNERRIEINEEDVAARLIFSSKHARMLENGTRNMAPRPFGRRALAETKEQVEAAIRRNVKAAL